MKKRLLFIICVPIAGLLLYMVFIKVRSLDFADNGPRLAVRWEGFYHDMNFRDIGDSVNKCLDQVVFQTGILTRSAGWFSGWSCDKIGNPNLIFSLNYSPEKAERYFCQGESEKTIGQFTNPQIKLKDLEFPETWKNNEMRLATCLFIRDIMLAMVHDKKSLVHCDAGRDRTGTISALLIAMAAEEKGMLTTQMLTAIECDYRKTASLDRGKHGRMKNFIEYLQSQGGVRNFLQNQCGLEARLIQQSADKLVHPSRTDQ